MDGESMSSPPLPPPPQRARRSRLSGGGVPAPLEFALVGGGGGGGGGGVALYPHQATALAWMRECEGRGGIGGGALADGVGMGKVTSVAAHLASASCKRGPLRTLVVAAPARVAHWVAALRARGLMAVEHVGARRSTWDTRGALGAARPGDEDIPRALARLFAYDVIVTSHTCVTAVEWRAAAAGAAAGGGADAWIDQRAPAPASSDGEASSGASNGEASAEEDNGPVRCSCLHSVAWGRVVVDDGHKVLGGRRSKLAV